MIYIPVQISNNTFKKDALLALLKENVPQEVLPKLTSLVDECEAIAFQKNGAPPEFNGIGIIQH